MKKFDNEEELDGWYDEEKERLMKVYLDERDLKKDETAISVADKKYNDALRKLIAQYQVMKEKIIVGKKK